MLILGYIGPGAGFAILSSFLVFLVALLLGVGIFLTAPLRVIWKLLRRRRRSRGRFRRVAVVGLDGLSPRLARRLLDAGALPNFAALEAAGSFQPLATTLPPISPAAWSTFQTGTPAGSAQHLRLPGLRSHPTTGRCSPPAGSSHPAAT